MKKWKQTMLREDAYNVIKEMKENAVRVYGKKMSFGDIIKESLNKELSISLLDDTVKSYLQEYIHELNKDDDIIGVILFGSIAKRTWNEYSDIDLFIVVKSDPVKCLHYTDKIDKKLYSIQKEIFKKGYGFYVSPLIVTSNSLDKNKMIYDEIRKTGIILFDRENILRDFMLKTKNKRENKNGKE
ncbi:MAG: nucleotidyltransferase domain-containing protein [Candidatus Parvarchaeum sp.]